MDEPSASYEPGVAVRSEDRYDGREWLVGRTTRPSSSPAETRTEAFEYDSDGNRTRATTPRGFSTEFCYDRGLDGQPLLDARGRPIRRGHLTRVIAPVVAAEGRGSLAPVTQYAFDDRDNLVLFVPPNGVASEGGATCASDFRAAASSPDRAERTYDAGGVYLQAISQYVTDPDTGSVQPRRTTLDYQDSVNNPGRITRVVPPRGNLGQAPDPAYATTYTYFPRGDSQAGLLASVRTPPVDGNSQGYATTYGYDRVGRRTSRVDANGNAPAPGAASEHTWTYEYDAEDGLIRQTSPAPAAGGAPIVTESHYDALGQRDWQRDANGNTTARPQSGSSAAAGTFDFDRACGHECDRGRRLRAGIPAFGHRSQLACPGSSDPGPVAALNMRGAAPAVWSRCISKSRSVACWRSNLRRVSLTRVFTASASRCASNVSEAPCPKFSVKTCRRTTARSSRLD